VIVASAGHGPILICRAATGAVEQVDATGPPLGVIAGARFASDHDITLAPGDMLLVVSDGIFEAPAPTPDAGRFGIARLMAILGDCGGRTGEEILDRLREEVTAFTGGAPPADDM